MRTAEQMIKESCRLSDKYLDADKKAYRGLSELEICLRAVMFEEQLKYVPKTVNHSVDMKAEMKEKTPIRKKAVRMPDGLKASRKKQNKEID